MTSAHPRSVSITPSILYFGTPVVLISSTNTDGSANLAPMSSAFWLGWRCMLGLDGSSKTTENLLRTGEGVLNLPSAGQVDAVDRIARLTGSDPVPEAKVMRQYTHEKDKFGTAGLTPIASETVSAPRAAECPVQMEVRVAGCHDLMADNDSLRGAIKVVEVRIERVHAHPDILADADSNRIDPDKWKPLIMSFQNFYGLADGKLQPSRLADIPEADYRPLAEIPEQAQS